MKVPSTSCTPSSSRMLFLDGIRGIMAINVVLNHFIIVFFPDMIFWDNGANSLNSTPLQAFYNGSIAVTFFFTLSAFLTSYLILQKRTFSIKDLITRIIKRYLRLIPIVLLAVLCTYLLMRLDLLYHLKIVY